MLCQQKLVPKIIDKSKKHHITSHKEHCRMSGLSNLLVGGTYS